MREHSAGKQRNNNSSIGKELSKWVIECMAEPKRSSFDALFSQFANEMVWLTAKRSTYSASKIYFVIRCLIYMLEKHLGISLFVCVWIFVIIVPIHYDFQRTPAAWKRFSIFHAHTINLLSNYNKFRVPVLVWLVGCWLANWSALFCFFCFALSDSAAPSKLMRVNALKRYCSWLLFSFEFYEEIVVHICNSNGGCCERLAGTRVYCVSNFNSVAITVEIAGLSGSTNNRMEWHGCEARGFRYFF